MRAYRHLLVCIFLSLSFEVRAAETVLVVSIDALHPGALSERATPALHALMESGRFTLNGKSVDPPKTLVAHTAMMTGLPPARNGKRDNDWQTGEPRIARKTLFDDAMRAGYRTAFYYSKPKLGYLVNTAVIEKALAPDDGIERVRHFFGGTGKRFAFLHISGLEWAGQESGWLSTDYHDELTQIDASLAPLFDEVAKRGAYAIVVTSDHAGHEREHGTGHPEDFKLPLIVAGNIGLPQIPKGEWTISGLRALLRSLVK